MHNSLSHFDIQEYTIKVMGILEVGTHFHIATVSAPIVCLCTRGRKNTRTNKLLQLFSTSSANHLALPPLDVDRVRELCALLGSSEGSGSTAKGRKRNLSIDIERCVTTAGRPEGEGNIIMLAVSSVEGTGDLKSGGDLHGLLA
jgi:hypothetical protein